jgi:hypothetical protein
MNSNETGKPDWVSTKGVYPLTELDDSGYRSSLESIGSQFNLKENMSKSVLDRYFSKEYCAEVFCGAGLGTYQDAFALFDIAWLGMLQPWRPFGSMTENIGMALHHQHKGREAWILASFACQGSFQGERGWTLFNQTLIQGAWPWLGFYPKAYAKIIYTTMACLFSIVRHGAGDASFAPLILALAGKLVDPTCFGSGPITFRVTDSLTDENVIYEPVRNTD